MERIMRYEDTLKQLAKQSLGDLNYAITMLMARAKLSYKWEIGPEQRVCIEFADALRVATKESRLKCIWFHVPNEGKRSRITATILKAMGMLSGVHDYAFIGKEKALFLEFKTLGNGLTDNQQHFALWAMEHGARSFICHTAQDGLDVLKKEGMLV